MSESWLDVEVVGLADADAAELAQLAAQLRRELLGTNVERVELARPGPPPDGSKALAGIAAGRLVVGVVRTAQQLRAVVAAVAGWLGNRPVRTVKIQLDGDVLEVTGISDADQRALIDAWIARHAVPANESGPV